MAWYIALKSVICYTVPRQNEMSSLQKSTKKPRVRTSWFFLFRLGKVAYTLGWLRGNGRHIRIIFLLFGQNFEKNLAGTSENVV